MKSWGIFFAIVFLILSGVIILNSVAPFLFPLYYLYIVIGIVLFILFSKLDFDILSVFSWHFYFGSLLFLIIPLLIGQVTRGAVRWIQIGEITIQPTEFVRPFLILFFANYLTKKEIDLVHLIKSVSLLIIPLVLILLQPSLGVALLTVVGFAGVVISSGVKKKSVIVAMLGFLMLLPAIWFVLAPYQKQRVLSFLSPTQDPTGASYNSLQSMISVGSGRMWGRGLGEGVQTQLLFLPERHSDFIFASVAEELGFVGAFLLLIFIVFLLYQVAKALESAKDFKGRAFISGLFLTLLVQSVIHIGMNMGLLPITGVPLPLVSAGGSSLIATMISLGMVVNLEKKV